MITGFGILFFIITLIIGITDEMNWKNFFLWLGCIILGVIYNKFVLRK